MSENEVKRVHFKCLNLDYSLLVIGVNGIRLYGVFKFQVLFGCVEINGYQCIGQKFSTKNFTHATVPIMNIPLNMHAVAHTKPVDDVTSVLMSRLRELVDDPLRIIVEVTRCDAPTGIVLIKHNDDFISRFINQQHSEPLFKSPTRSVSSEIGRLCYLVENSLHDKEYNALYSSQEYYWVANIMERLYKNSSINQSKIGEYGRVFIVGAKDVGKSTLLRYIINSILSKIPNFPFQKPKRIFLLDCDVGQSEFSPPGLISLHEITAPLFSASFACQRDTLRNSFFFGSNSPNVDIKLYRTLVVRCLRLYELLKTDDTLLLVNTVGWIEVLGIGYDLLCDLLRDIKPTNLISIQMENVLPFEVPSIYRQITNIFKRNSNEITTLHKKPPALLRSFLVAGYFAQCFNLRPPTSSAELRLADVLAYRVRFKPISIFFHPELPYVADHLIFSALNCCIVALCCVDFNTEENSKCFKKRKIFDVESLPERVVLQKEMYNCEKRNDNVLPVLRCYGYGFIRAIDLERRLFYVITPIEKSLLTSVNLFACGHELQSPSILFDLKSLDPAPYLVELDNRVTSRNHQKLFSPLKNITGFKRTLSSRQNSRHTLKRYKSK